MTRAPEYAASHVLSDFLFDPACTISSAYDEGELFLEVDDLILLTGRRMIF